MNAYLTMAAGLLLAEGAGAEVARVEVDLGARTGEVRPALHSSSWRSNLTQFEPAHVQEIRRLHMHAWRSHDAPLVDAGQRVIDTHFIFPSMKLDATDPESYFFAATDHLLKRVIEEDGLKVFYRLGSSIEHTSDAHATNTLSPVDHDKYAEVLAGIVRHYNRGWANGFRWNIKYWELFNEPDWGKCWRGSREEFADLFVTCMKRLKDEFGDEIKVGGPSFTLFTKIDEPFVRELLDACKKAGVKPDFFSWHHYGNDPDVIAGQPETIRKLLADCGFGGLELVLDEWHYVAGNLKQAKKDPVLFNRIYRGPAAQCGIDSAAFALTVESKFQDTCLDQSFFYGCGRDGPDWGYFNPVACRLNKTYFAMQMMGEVVAGGKFKARCMTAAKGVTPFAAASADGSRAVVTVADYRSGAKEIEVGFKNLGGLKLERVRVLDNDRDLEEISAKLSEDGVLTLPKDALSACYLIELSKAGPTAVAPSLQKGPNMAWANRANLAAVDHLGRKLVSQAEAGAVKQGRQVGLFYYLWLGQHGTRGPWDVSKMLEQDPDVFNKPDSPLWPDMSRTPILHWGEPLWGYYLSTDEWVLRRQVEMFIQAGVDVLYFDTTNGYHYREVTDKLFAILQEYHDRGFAAPKFCYYMAPARRGCGTSNVLDVWLNYYKDRKFSDLYFMWEGKPLIITHPDRSYRQEIWDFFTFRRPTWGCPEKLDTWYWSGMPKQGVAVSSKGVREMLPVTVATPHVAPESPDKANAGWNLGSQEANWRNDMQSRSCRSDLGGRRDTRPNAAHYGIFFQEQIDWALAREREDVPLAFICQWNEWVSPTLTKSTNDMFGRMPHWLIMMDECSMEASRDIEPMKGGYRDAYYLQMMNFIRRWKGLPEPAKATCSYDFAADDLDAWAKVSPSYEEMTGDCAPRNHPGFDNVGVYTNYTGRNEFKLLKVAALKDAVAFYAETVKPLTPASDPHWMELFVKVPGQQTDAMGYTHRIDRTTKDVVCAHRGSRLVYVVPAKLLGVDVAKPFQLEFKWSDNRQSDDVMDFYVNGDAAPRGRLNWLFIRDN